MHLNLPPKGKTQDSDISKLSSSSQSCCFLKVKAQMNTDTWYHVISFYLIDIYGKNPHYMPNFLFHILFYFKILFLFNTYILYFILDHFD